MPTTKVPPQNTLRQQKAGICLALAAITIGVFGQSVQFDFINFDDDDYVVNNPMVARGLTLRGIVWAFTHFHAANWHPLTWISHMLDCELYGLEPGGHHLSSVLIHAAAVVALFLALCRMTRLHYASARQASANANSETGGTPVLLQENIWRCAFVAAVFAIHPLRAESVAWVSERKDVLSGLFFMLTIGAYVRYARQAWSPARYGLVVLLFALGLLCKPMLVTAPLILLLLDYWPLQRAKPVWNLVLEKLPLLALSAASCVITVFAQKHAIRPFEALPLKARLAGVVLSYKAYLVQMFYPAGLAAFYPFPHIVSPWEKLMSAMLLAVISGLVWAERRTRPWLLTGWLWYLLMLLPVVGIIQVGAQAHADRYTYLPQIGIYLAVTWLAAELAGKWQVNRMAVGGFMGAVIGVLMVCTWIQTGYWRNSETLWRHALAVTTDNDVAYVNLGHELYRQGRLAEAIDLYHKALQVEPNNAEFHNNLGNALRENGNRDAAIIEYEKAVHSNPGFADAQFNLGKALYLEGKPAEAAVHFQTALQIDPNFLLARVNLGNALLQEGKADQAAVQFEKALAISTNNADIHLNLGLCFFQLGRVAEAKSQYEQALQLNPNDPRIQNNLAWLMAAGPSASLRDGSDAVVLALEANQRTSGANPVVLHTLAAAYAQAGRFPDAVQTAQQALHLAELQSNRALAGQLQEELKLYGAGKPFPLPEKDDSAGNSEVVK